LPLRPAASGGEQQQGAVAGGAGASASAYIWATPGGLLQVINPNTSQQFPVRQAPDRAECVVYTVSGTQRRAAWSCMRGKRAARIAA
jgi:hypothetical protein